MRQVYLPKHRDSVKIPVYDRYALLLDTVFEGPAIIEERESTVVVNGPAKIRVDEYKNLIVDIPVRR
jgi:N-methylhydantoinase A